LITHLPDTVSKWIGQQVQNLGEDGDESRVRGAAGMAVQQTSKGISEGAGGASAATRGMTKTKFGGGDGGGQYDSGETDGGGDAPLPMVKLKENPLRAVGLEPRRHHLLPVMGSLMAV